MSAADMLTRCFRHQHPEAYGRDEVVEPVVPNELRYGSDVVAQTEAVDLEPMGNGETL